MKALHLTRVRETRKTSLTGTILNVNFLLWIYFSIKFIILSFFFFFFFLTSLSSVVNSLEPEWAAAASAVKEQTKGKVRLGAVDATVHQVVSGRYGVSKNP